MKNNKQEDLDFEIGDFLNENFNKNLITFDEFCKGMTGHTYKELEELYGDKPSERYVKFKPKVREHWRKDALIVVKTFMKTTENPKDSFKNEFIGKNIKIKDPYGNSRSSFFENNEEGKEKALKFIKDGLYL